MKTTSFFLLSSAFLAVSGCHDPLLDDQLQITGPVTLEQALPKGGGGVNGQADYCTGGDICTTGEGDCDFHAQCDTGLCAADVGEAYGMGVAADVCVPTGYGCDTDPCGAPECGATNCGCDVTGGGYGTPGDGSYCTTACKCDDGYGDCDYNSQCQSGLCAQDVGAAYGFNPDLDICVPTGFDCDTDPCGAPECGAGCSCDPTGGGDGVPGSASYCTALCPCVSGYGDCDYNSQCQSGLCAQNVGAAYGLPATTDVCVPTGYGCDTAPCAAPECGATGCSCDPVGGGNGTPNTTGYCSSYCPCADGYGDCNQNADCQSGLCAQDVGAAFGLPATADVCVPTGYSCDTDPCGAVECGATSCLCDPVGGGFGTPGDGAYCTEFCPCESGFGDCDRAGDCVSGLCAQDVGAAYGFNPDLDICVPTGFDCDTDPCGAPECGAGCSCDPVGGGNGTPGGSSYCTVLCPCVSGYGDCDYNSQCQSGLCAQDVGPAYGLSSVADVCVPTGYSCDTDPCGAPECGGSHCSCDPVGGGNGTPYAAGYCTAYCPCADGYGDCNYNSDCQSGLCAQNVGAAYGLLPTLDLCLPSGLGCDTDPCGDLGCGATNCCGNGATDPGEECDDGNNEDGDGCSAACLTETCRATRVVITFDGETTFDQDVPYLLTDTSHMFFSIESINVQAANGKLDNLVVSDALGNPIFTEDFSDGSDWIVCSSPLGNSNISGGTANAVADWNLFHRQATPLATGAGLQIAADTYWASSTNGFGFVLGSSCRTSCGDSCSTANMYMGVTNSLMEYGQGSGPPIAGVNDNMLNQYVYTEPWTAPSLGWHPMTLDIRPSQCAVCGDGVLDTGEECDDGNNEDGDGCSATCEIEWDQIYNATDDFSTTDNPNGVWSQGWVAENGDPLTLYEDFVADVDGGFDVWFDANNVVLGAPSFAKNSSDSTLQGVEPGQLNLHPGAEGERSILRWTSPLTGSCDIHAVFYNGNIGETDAVVTVDAVTVFGPESTNGDVEFNQVIDVAIGSVIDFSVGSLGHFGADSTPIEAIISCSSSSLCGDGNLDPGEECDDGNNDAGDGCSAVCLLEVEADCAVLSDGRAIVDPITTGVSPFTIEGWFYLDSFPSSWSSFFRHWNGCDPPGAFSVNLLSNGNISAHGSNASPKFEWGPMPLEQWAHVAVVYSPTTTDVYVNGVRVAGGSAGTGSGTACELVFGGHLPDTTSGINGMFDELRLSSVVRYSSSFTPQRYFVPDGDTIGLWHLDEGTGSTFADTSGNNHTGDVVSAIWVEDDCAPVGSTANPGDSCLDILNNVPGSTDGNYWIDPTGSSPFQVYCDMTTDGGGWTLTSVHSDDGQDNWTWNNRRILDTDTSLFGGLVETNRDLKSQAHHDLDFSDVMVVHQPSGVWGSYHHVGDGTESMAELIGRYGDDYCWEGLSGFPMTSGTLSAGGNLCSTELFINPADLDGGNTECSVEANDAHGLAWSVSNNQGCPLDDPGYISALGPGRIHPDSEQTVEGNHPWIQVVGFGWALGLNTGARHVGANYMQVYVRESDCGESACGDGNLDPGEECDDGNNDDSDGCSAVCEFEPDCYALADGKGMIDPITPGVSPFTIEGWYHLDSYKFSHFFRHWDSCAPPGAFSANLLANGSISVHGENAWPKFEWGPVPLLQWFHVAVVYAPSSTDVYINGTRVTGGAAGTGTGAACELAIGGHLPDTANDIDGMFDEIRLSSVVRYSGSFTPKRYFAADGDTVGLWHMNEGTGATFADTSGNNHTGDVVSASWVQPDCAPRGSASNPGYSCLDILDHEPASTDGSYWIDPSGGAPFEAYCDMTTDGGGWTLIAQGGRSGCSTMVESQDMMDTSSCAYLTQPVVASLAASAQDVMLNIGNSTATFGDWSRCYVTNDPVSTNCTSQSLDGLAVEALLTPAATWHNGAAFDSWDWTVMGCPPDRATGWPSMYHACGNGDGVHWVTAPNWHDARGFDGGNLISATFIR